VILLDTHTLIWLDTGLDLLGKVARTQLDAALQTDRLAVSAISFWETGMLVRKGRLKISIDLFQWRADLLSGGLQELPVTGTLGIQAASLESFHGDPADRMIVATAIEKHALLATADEAILNWNGSINCLDARR
jgi:PIN domain nuclease of toxin-antitoxin system